MDLCVFAAINIHEAKLLQPITSHQLTRWLLRHALGPPTRLLGHAKSPNATTLFHLFYFISETRGRPDFKNKMNVAITIYHYRYVRCADGISQHLPSRQCCHLTTAPAHQQNITKRRRVDDDSLFPTTTTTTTTRSRQQAGQSLTPLPDYARTDGRTSRQHNASEPIYMTGGGTVTLAARLSLPIQPPHTQTMHATA